jgi:hypothetical protein
MAQALLPLSCIRGSGLSRSRSRRRAAADADRSRFAADGEASRATAQNVSLDGIAGISFSECLAPKEQ